MCPPRGGAGAGVGVGMLRGRGIPFIENKKVFGFLGFSVSKMQKVIDVSLGDIDPEPNVSIIY